MATLFQIVSNSDYNENTFSYYHGHKIGLSLLIGNWPSHVHGAEKKVAECGCQYYILLGR